MNKSLAIMGIRGVPARHGGFETFAEYLSLYLVEHGWNVTVYCQGDSAEKSIRQDRWQGINRVIIPVAQSGAVGTIVFDWKSIRHVLGTEQDLVLTLGYNTASFCLPYRFKGICNLINMDGIEWKREKWHFYERAWLWLNERCGCWLGNHLVADHPEIANHLATRVSRDKITMIPYGAPEVTEANPALLAPMGLKPGRFVTVIARPEPENSVLEIVRAFSRHPRGYRLVMLGKYKPDENFFHREVLDAASDEVLFPGAIYDKEVVQAIRLYGRFYIHGHRVGGTNPSLVEALGAGSAVLAHDNRFNRWVAGEEAHFFADEDECSTELNRLLDDDEEIARMQAASRKIFQKTFTWGKVLAKYEWLLEDWLQRSRKTKLAKLSLKNG